VFCSKTAQKIAFSLHFAFKTIWVSEWVRPLTHI